MFVSTNGDFHVCEKIPGNAPLIGNVYEGFDFPAIEKFYVREYMETAMRHCSRCWAVRHCDLCYVHAVNSEGKFDTEQKYVNCLFYLKTFQKFLSYFCKLKEENPERLNYLYDLDIQ